MCACACTIIILIIQYIFLCPFDVWQSFILFWFDRSDRWCQHQRELGVGIVHHRMRIMMRSKECLTNGVWGVGEWGEGEGDIQSIIRWWWLRIVSNGVLGRVVEERLRVGVGQGWDCSDFWLNSDFLCRPGEENQEFFLYPQTKKFCSLVYFSSAFDTVYKCSLESITPGVTKR